MVEGTPYESLPANWNSFDLNGFSRQKQLWDYQRTAVQSAIAALWKYYEEFGNY
jgi:type III restriction enzyme